MLLYRCIAGMLWRMPRRKMVNSVSPAIRFISSADICVISPRAQFSANEREVNVLDVEKLSCLCFSALQK